MTDISLRIIASATDNASSTIQKLGSAFGPVGIGIATVGLALVGAGTAAVKMAGDFQSMTTTLVTGAGESTKNIDMVRQGLLAMSVTTGTSVQQLTSGMFMVESAGYHGAAGLQVMQVAAEGAKVGNADLGTVANALTTVMQDYGIKATNAATAMNFLTAIVQNGKTTMQDLSGAMSQILPTASAVGVHLTDVGAAMATMTGEGVPAANAATYLRQMLISLSAPASAGAASLQAIGLTTQQVSDAMKTSLPGALSLIMQHLQETYTVGSPQYVNALKNISGGSKQMQGMLDLTGSHLATFQQNMQNVTNVMNQSKGAVAGWSNIQGNFNFKVAQAQQALSALMIEIGTKLLPAVTPVVGAIGTVIASFTQWIMKTNAIQVAMDTVGRAFQFVGNIIASVRTPIAMVIQAFQQVIAPVYSLKNVFFQAAQATKPLLDTFDRATGVFHGVALSTKPLLDTFDRASAAAHTVVMAVDPLMDTFDRATAAFNRTTVGAQPMLDTFDRATAVFPKVTQAANPFIPVVQNIVTVLKVVATVIGTVVGFISANFVPAFLALINVVRQVWSVLVVIGSFLAATFRPVWQQLAQTFNSQLKPAWNDLLKAIQPIMPELQMFAKFLGGVLVVVLVLLVGVLAGVVKAFAGLLTGAITVFGGIVTVISGALQIVMGVIAFFVDLFTGKWNKLGSDIITITQGWVRVFAGIWQIISGVFQAAIGVVVGLVSGFFTTVIGIFQNLSTILVGHSIVPDMINAIVSCFAQLPGRALQEINTLVTSAMNAFNSFASQAIQSGANLVQGFINGMMSKIGAAAAGAQSIVSTIAGYLGFHSPAKLGEGQHIIEWGQNAVKGFMQGMNNMQPQLQAQMQAMIQAPTGNTTNISRGNNTFHIHVNLQGSGNAGHDASQIATLLGNHVRAQFGNI